MNPSAAPSTTPSQTTPPASRARPSPRACSSASPRCTATVRPTPRATRSSPSRSLARFVQFTLVTEDGRALTELCALAGYACIRLPAKALGGETAALEALHDFSAFMTTHAQALMDGVIEPDELARIEKRADAAQRAIAQVVALARRQREEAKR